MEVTGLEIEPQATTTEILSYNRSTSAYTDLVLYAKDMILLPQSGGNVGIGTTGPTALLHLSGASPYIYIDDTSTTGTKTRLQLISGDVGTTQSGLFGFNNTAGTATLNVLTFNELGNVGIGTTSPSQKLHLQNGVLLVDSNTPTATGIWMPDTNGNPSLRIVTDQSAANYSSIVNAWGNSSNTGVMVGSTRNDGFAFQVRSGVTLTDGFANDTGNSRMVVLGNGNVSVGDTTAQRKFNVIDATDAWIRINATNYTSDWLIGTAGSSNKFKIYSQSAGLTRLAIDSTGSVGIGTTGVFANSHILNLSGTGIAIKNDTNGSSNNWSQIKNTAAGSGSNLVFLTATGTNIMDDSGNVGIGTTNPVVALNVNGSSNTTSGLYIQNQNTAIVSVASEATWLGTGSSNNAVVAAYGSNSLLFGTNATEKMRITSTGNVGINRTSLVEKFEVGGDSAFYGAIKGYTGSSSNQYLSILQSAQGNTYISTGTSGETINFSTGSTQNVTNINVAGTATATNFILSSDETLKDKIKDIETKHINVEWKNFELISEPGVKRSGVIAQELEEKHPEFVRTDKDGLKSVAYIDLLITKIAELEARLEKAGL